MYEQFKPWVTRKGDEAKCKRCGQVLMRVSRQRQFADGFIRSVTLVEDIDASGSADCPDGVLHQVRLYPQTVVASMKTHGRAALWM